MILLFGFLCMFVVMKLANKMETSEDEWKSLKIAGNESQIDLNILLVIEKYNAGV